MSNSLLIWFALIWLMMIFVIYRWYTRHTTAEDLITGTIEVHQTDAEGLSNLLNAASVSPGRVRAVNDLLSEDSICWSSGLWGWLDRMLMVPKLFGPSGENCVGIKDGRVISLSLVNHKLTDLSAPAALDALKTLQLRDGQITSLAGVPDNCPWLSLNLERNKLTDTNLLSRCINLRRLNISFNKVSMLSGLEGLAKLEELNASNNQIGRIEGVAGHASLSSVDLSNNWLTSVATFNRLPNLRTLGIAHNEIRSLAGMGDLPQLLMLRAGANPIAEVETEIIEQFPLLQNASFVNTEIARMPEGYVSASDRPTGTEIVRMDSAGTSEENPSRLNISTINRARIDVAHTALAEVLKATFVAAFDSDKITPVNALPIGRGYANGTSRRGWSKRGLSSGVDFEGEIETLKGTHAITFEVDRSVGVTFRASLEEGMMRVYLKDAQGGFFYKETIPGHPVEISGMLITGSSTYLVFLESVDGVARGIKWSCK